jgi:hypothetical protein
VLFLLVAAQPISTDNTPVNGGFVTDAWLTFARRAQLRIKVFMNRATDLRHMADLCKRMAAIPTSGGHRADRKLLTLADKLDHEAARLEVETKPPPAGLTISRDRSNDSVAPSAAP